MRESQVEITNTGVTACHHVSVTNILRRKSICSDMYVRDMQKGICVKEGKPKILKEYAASAWVDGNNLLGPVIGNFCMDLAIRKAKEAGVGWVVAKGKLQYNLYIFKHILKKFM